MFKCSKIYKFDNFRLSAAEYRLSKNDNTIELKPKAFDVLLFLIQKSGQVIRKDELKEAVWSDTYVSATSISQNIYQIRKALGDRADGVSYIETIPRRGYRFNAEVIEIRDILFNNPDNHNEAVCNGQDAGTTSLITTKDNTRGELPLVGDSTNQIELEQYKKSKLKKSRRSFHSLLKQKTGILAILIILIISIVASWHLLQHRGNSSDVSYNQQKSGTSYGANWHSSTNMHTYNAEAHQYYLMGMALSNKRTIESLNQAKLYFQQAIEADSNYSLAYAGLADTYHLISLQTTNFADKSEYINKAETSAVKALTLNNSLAEPYTVIAAVRLFRKDAVSSEQAYIKSISINPSYPAARLRYGWLLFEQGKLEEAISEMRNAQELDPLSAANNLDLSFLLILVRRFDEALKYCKRAIELEPEIPHGYRILARIYLHKGLYDESVNAYKEAAKNSDERNYSLLGEAYIHALGGRRLSALKILSSVESKEPSFDPYHIALVYAALGNTDNALNWLSRLKADCPVIPMMLRFDPRLDVIRNDPRFEQLLKVHPIEKIPV